MTSQMTAQSNNLETPERQFANRLAGTLVLSAIYVVAMFVVRLVLL